jgi:hypothetical protein
MVMSSPTIDPQALAAGLASSAARTLHPPLKVGGGPVPGGLGCEKQLDDICLRQRYSPRRYALFQMTAGSLVVVRLFVVFIGHLRSLSGLLKNDYNPELFIANRLEFLINDPKSAVGRKQRFLLVKIRR